MKTLYIVRGVPGSGKSTFAQSLDCPVFEADQYFIDSETGERVQNLSLIQKNETAYIKFLQPLNVNDRVIYKVRSIAPKNSKGYYEVPLNWQNNPLNDTVNDFTFGEVIDHLRTIVENVREFEGTFPGIGNLANIGPVSQYGRKFMQHTGPMSISALET